MGDFKFMNENELLQTINSISLDSSTISNIILVLVTSIIIPTLKKIFSKKITVAIKEFKFQFLGLMSIAYLFYPLLIFGYLKLIIFYVDYNIKNNLLNYNNINSYYFSIVCITILIFAMFFLIIKEVIDNKLIKMKKYVIEYVINSEKVKNILNLSKRTKIIYIGILIIYVMSFIFAFWLAVFKKINLDLFNKIITTIIYLWFFTLALFIVQYYSYKHKFYIVPKMVIKMDYNKQNKCYLNYIVNAEYYIKYYENIIEVYNSHNKLVISFPLKPENFIGIQRYYEVECSK